MAGGSSAMAATPGTAEHHQVLSATAPAESHGTARQPADPWIAGQLAAFNPSAAHRLAIFDPWIKDQLALSCLGRQ
ncbi:hypothetical protein ACIHEJ_37820 [Streptomyces sp. NPDC052301]|uniref:hypothetical protein n=1 Tax=Streptomyces sp. NPDC052301 TaxID=3365687 RepID=UPI0037D09F4D